MTQKILIIGGGLNGPLMALSLAQAGLASTVLDAQSASAMSDAGFDGRAYALTQGSRQMLAALGLWPSIAPLAQPMLDIQVTEGRIGTGAFAEFLHFDGRMLSQPPFGHMVEDRHLRPLLIAACQANPLIDYCDGVSVQASGPGWVEAAGRRYAARLIIAADGKASPIAAAAGIRRIGWNYGQTAIVCAVDHELPHRGCAHELFLPSGPFAILPLRGNRSSIVWSEKTAIAEALMRADEPLFMAALRQRFGDFLGALTLVGRRWAYPLGISAAEVLVRPGLALIGDAARVMHPLAGQGLNYGLRDVAALAQVLVEAYRRGEDLGAIDVLERYQRWRAGDNALMLASTDALNKLFSNDFAPLSWLRRKGMQAFGQLPGLRRMTMDLATGMAGEVPLLLQGKTL